MTKPRCFISYAWESNKHKDWVRTLADKLVENGVETFLDQWDIELGSDVPEYMETCVRESDFIILVCTPAFTAKANSGEGGVGYEKHIVTGEIYKGAASQKKFVPLLRRGNPDDSLPSYLKSKYYIDFRRDNEFDIKLVDLLRHIYQSPKYKRPPLGVPPVFTSMSDRPLPHTKTTGQEVGKNLAATIKEVSKFVGSPSGPFLSTSETKEFIEWWVEHCADVDFGDFKRVYQYASSLSGMALYVTEALEFAKLWITEYAGKDFDEFKKIYSHATSFSGMSMLPEDAIQFALKMMKGS